MKLQRDNSAFSSAFSTVTGLASQRSIHTAFAWLHGNPKKIMDWQIELIGIPAPPFGEAARTAWIATKFNEVGLANGTTDAIGNVFGLWPAADQPRESTGPVIVLSAHLDTVFPADTPLDCVVSEDRIEAPGAMDNAAGVVGMLAVAQAIVAAALPVPVPIVFLANVGEEGEGDLRGIRHFYQQNPLASRIVAHIVLDGAGVESAVSSALGSRRYQITIKGPGGHSFTDAGTANPIAALSAALVRLMQIELPTEPRTTLNIGTIHGGTSVNSIPEEATASVDMRSTSTQQLTVLEVMLHRAVEDAVEEINGLPLTLSESRKRTPLRFQIATIGDRPAAELAEDSALLKTLRAVDRHLSLRTDLRLGSTDANLPLSLGVPAISLGAGGDGGGAHTRAEWYSAKNRELGLRRILLFLSAVAEWAADQ